MSLPADDICDSRSADAFHLICDNAEVSILLGDGLNAYAQKVGVFIEVLDSGSEDLTANLEDWIEYELHPDDASGLAATSAEILADLRTKAVELTHQCRALKLAGDGLLLTSIDGDL